MKHTASFDVDAQCAFTPLCPDELPVPGGQDIVPALNRQATHASLRLGSKDAHCREAIWCQPGAIAGAHFDRPWPTHAVPGTPGFALLPGLPHPAEYDFFVWKGVEPDMHPYGACYHDLCETRSTGVIEFLKQRQIHTVLVGGLALEYCVQTTALQLQRAGFQVVVHLAACRALNADATQQAIHTLMSAQIQVVHAFEAHV